MRGGALLLLGLCFLAGAGLRLADVDITAVEGMLFAPARAEGPDQPAADEAAALIAALRAREAALDAREESLTERAARLDAAEARLREEIDALAALEEDLRGIVARAEAGAEEDVARLTAIYAAMRPEDAARVFGEMEPVFAAGFLARMSADAAAAVLAALPPDRGYAISVELAGRAIPRR